MNKKIFSNPKIKQEFLDRFRELNDISQSEMNPIPAAIESVSVGLESMDMSRLRARATRFSTDDAAAAATAMEAGTTEALDPGLEAIILRFGRPAYFIQNNTFDTDSTPSSSVEVDNVVNGARSNLELAIPKVGRINLRNHRAPWVGTGWIVAPNVLVTNRHVASEFAQRDGDGFVFVETAGRAAKAELDTGREHKSPTEAVYQLRKVLWMAPPTGSQDVAFLSIEPVSIDDQEQPQPIPLMDKLTFDSLPADHWAAAIGYPAFSIFNDAQDQQRIFDGIFNVKRLQPGQIKTRGNDGIVNHDATTLGGNSGSVVLDLTSGSAIALHFGGIEGQTNSSVAAPIVAQLLDQNVSNFI